MSEQSKPTDKTQSQEIKPKKSIFAKIGLDLPIFNYRTPFDRSDRPCIDNILLGTAQSFLITYGITAGISLLKAILNLRKTMKDPSAVLQALISPDKISAGATTSFLTFSIKSIITVLRIITKKDDGSHAFLGGFIGGYLSLFLLKSDKKVFISCLMLARGIECIYNHFADKGYYPRKAIHW
eukprot:CAMPEP_0114581610 /NCGR_PEP_ID=MMETSP0125-20121206/5697_1 /TAXON_ID=485358 ORGANISM="Aristerostoma sp., Strain ATCC 50986" /NCGR_SAMPLE_ID=MMETSP0125 /ASSEMBLY_ACC=CAM_ASM_000245 /LENGTH=181 /DNA_ID=CAMNT_0001773947 /DNA_START=44 /DNA_END=586 /DNA_ORIENTATION=-